MVVDYEAVAKFVDRKDGYAHRHHDIPWHILSDCIAHAPEKR